MAKKSTDRMNYETWWQKFAEINRYDPGTKWRTEEIIGILRRYSIRNLIDLGTGSGELLQAIKASLPNIELYAADLSKKALQEVKKRKIAKKAYAVDLEKPEILRLKFDAIICSEVIEHLSNWQITFDFISKIAHRGTIAIITTQSGKIYPHVAKMGHLNHFGASELTREFEENGFKIILAQNYGRPFMDVKNILVSTFMSGLDKGERKLNLLEKIGMGIFYYLYKYLSPLPGPQLIVVAKKK